VIALNVSTISFPDPFWINYILVDRGHLHYVFVFSMQEVLLGVFSILTQCIHLASSIKSPLFDHQFFHLWSLLQVFCLGIPTTMSDEGCKMPRNGVGPSSIIQIPFTQPRHELRVHVQESDFSIQGHAIFFAWTTTLISLDRTLKFFYSNSTSNPFSLVVIPLPIPTTSSP
jgi:hypothetical protein